MQALFTAEMLAYAHHNTVPLDYVLLTSQVVGTPASDIEELPPKGCYLNGLILEGATWDFKDQCLQEPDMSKRVTMMPVLWVHPDHHKAGSESTATTEAGRKSHPHARSSLSPTRAPPGSQAPRYLCPVYCTNRRRVHYNQHADEFILSTMLDAGKRQSAHWVFRSVAMFCAFAE